MSEKDFGTHDYIGTAACGCILAVVVDVPGNEKFTAESIAGYVKRGMTINRISHAEFNLLKFGRRPDCAVCNAKKAEAKQDLPQGELFA